MAHMLVAVSAALSLLVTVILLKQRVLPKIPLTLVVFSLLLVIAGAGMIYHHEDKIAADLSRRSWPTTEGVVIKSEIAGIRAFRPEITCEYQVDGHIYQLTTNLDTPGFGNKRSRRDTAGRILRDYPEGKKVIIYYHPADPAKAFLRVGPAWHTFMKLGLGIIILITGLTGFTGNFLDRIIKTKTSSRGKVIA